MSKAQPTAARTVLEVVREKLRGETLDEVPAVRDSSHYEHHREMGYRGGWNDRNRSVIRLLDETIAGLEAQEGAI